MGQAVWVWLATTGRSSRRCLLAVHAKPHLHARSVSGNHWPWSCIFRLKSSLHSQRYVEHAGAKKYEMLSIPCVELEYQISVLQPKVLLVHPNLIATAKIAAAKAKLPENRLYLFSDRETPSIDSFKDWRTILGTAEEGETWQWRKLSPEESQTRVAAINFSSGYTFLNSE
jgi:hypothetical protein